MTTLTELVASIHSSLHSYSGVQEQVTWLTAGVDAAVTSFPVNNADEIQRGIAEVDNELVFVSTTAAGTLTLAPFGRGFRGSTAATHAINAMVTAAPVFPKVEIIKAINQCIESLFPTLYQIKTTTLVGTSTGDVSYALPADCEQVLGITMKTAGDTNDYYAPVIGSWFFDTNGVGGNILNLMLGGIATADIRVTYMARFGALTSDFAAAGLSESYADLITFGVAARMLRFLDANRVQLGSVENTSRAQVVQAGDAGRLANQMYAMYQTRIAEERRRLLTTSPITPNFLPR